MNADTIQNNICNSNIKTTNICRTMNILNINRGLYYFISQRRTYIWQIDLVPLCQVVGSRFTQTAEANYSPPRKSYWVRQMHSTRQSTLPWAALTLSLALTTCTFLAFFQTSNCVLLVVCSSSWDNQKEFTFHFSKGKLCLIQFIFIFFYFFCFVKHILSVVPY